MIKSLFIAAAAVISANAQCEKPQLVVTLWDSFGDGWDTAYWRATDPSDNVASFQPSCSDAEILTIDPCDHTPSAGNYSMEVSTGDETLPEASWEVYWRVDVVDENGEPTGTYLEGGYGTTMVWAFDGDNWSLTDYENEANNDCVKCSGQKCSKSKSKKKSDSSKSKAKTVKKLRSNAMLAKGSAGTKNSTGSSEVEDVYTYGSPNTDLTVKMNSPDGNGWNDVSPIGARWTISDITNTEVFETGSLCKGKKGDCKICLGDGTYIFRATSEITGNNTETEDDRRLMLKSGPKGGSSNSTESEESEESVSSNSTDGDSGKKSPVRRSRPNRKKVMHNHGKKDSESSNSTWESLKHGPTLGSNSTESEESEESVSSNSTDSEDGKKSPSRRSRPNRKKGGKRGGKKGSDSDSNSTYSESEDTVSSNTTGGKTSPADADALKHGPTLGSNSTESEESEESVSSNSTDSEGGKKSPSRRSRPNRQKGGKRGGKKGSDSDSNSTYSESEESEESVSSNSTDSEDGKKSGKKSPSRRSRPNRKKGGKKGSDSDSNSTYSESEDTVSSNTTGGKTSPADADALKHGPTLGSNSTESEGTTGTSNSTRGSHSKKRPSPKPRPSQDAWKFCHTGGNFGDQLTFHIKNGKCYPDDLTWAGETCGESEMSFATIGGVISLDGMHSEMFSSSDYSVILSTLADSVNGWDLTSMQVTATSLQGRSLASSFTHDIQFSVSFTTEDFGVDGTLYAAAEALVADMSATLNAAISSGDFVQSMSSNALLAGSSTVKDVSAAHLVSLEILSITYENNRLVYYYDSESASTVSSEAGPALSASVVVMFVAVIALAGVAVVGMIAHSYGSYQKVATASDSEVSEKVWLSGLKSKFGVKFEKLPAESEQLDFGLKI